MVGFGKLIVWCQPNRLFNIIFNRLWTSMLCSASCIWSCVTEFIDSPKVGVYKGILALWSLSGLNKPMFRWTVSWYEICNELKNVPKHPQQVNEYIESWDVHVAIQVEMDCFINGLVTNLLESQVARMSKIQDQNPRKPNAICNYPLRSCSTTVGGGRQPTIWRFWTSNWGFNGYWRKRKRHYNIAATVFLVTLWRRTIYVPRRSYWYDQPVQFCFRRLYAQKHL